jgi:hypothetical protein
MIAVPLDRGLSDTDKGEVNQDNSTKKRKNRLFVVHPITDLIKIKYCSRRGSNTKKGQNASGGTPYRPKIHPNTYHEVEVWGFFWFQLSQLSLVLGQ